LSCARSERNATRVRSGNLRVGGAGGPAFKLQKPPQMRVPRPSRTLRRAGTTTAYTTGGVERARVAPAASPPTPSASSGQALAKTQGWGTLRGNDAMQRWATLYNLVGVVKRHVECPRSATSLRCRLLNSSFWFLLIRKLLMLLSFLLTRPQLAFRISRWKLVPPTIYSVFSTMIRGSDSPTLRGGKAPNQPSDGLSSTRVAHGLPCMRTSCA